MFLSPEFERALSPKRKELLHSLREQGWVVTSVEINPLAAEWALDQIWSIESKTVRHGYCLLLWFFKYGNAQIDAIDRVTVTLVGSPTPNYYYQEPEIDFKARKGFQKALRDFLTAIHQWRTEIIRPLEG